MTKLSSPLLRMTPAGLFCEAGGFYIDPVQTVRTALITHAHADHARRGSAAYQAVHSGLGILRLRLGPTAKIFTHAFGESLRFGSVTVSFHPAGHILGSAQIRVEHRGEVWCVTGDYKLQADPTCEPWEPVTCHTLVTEVTFGHPDFQWPSNETLFASVNQWWRSRRDRGLPSVILAYALGKAQRILASIDHSIGPVVAPKTIVELNHAYRAAGIELPATFPINQPPVVPSAYGQSMESTVRELKASELEGSLTILPPGWYQSLKGLSKLEGGIAMASGWVLQPDRSNLPKTDQGFAISDHADWPGLLHAISASSAMRVLVTHGEPETLVKHLRSLGIEADSLIPAASSVSVQKP